MQKYILLTIIFFSQGIMSWGQSDTLSYESIMGYYKSKTNMIEFYKLSENSNKVNELTTERDLFIEKLGDSWGKGWFYAHMSYKFWSSGAYQEALENGNKAVDIFSKVFGMKSVEYAGLLNNLALIHSDLGNYTEALDLGTRALEIRGDLLGPEHPDYAGSLENIAIYNTYLGNYSEALKYEQKAMEIKKTVLGTEHLDYINSLSNLAYCYDQLGNYPEAIGLGTEAIELLKRVLGTEHRNYATALDNLAGYYSDFGNYVDAIRIGTEVMEIKKRILGPEHPDCITSLANLANYNYHIGNYPEAISLGTEVMKLLKKILGSEHPDYATALNNIAGYYYTYGDFKEAIRLGTEALEIRKNILGLNHPSYSESLSNLALYNEQVGNDTESIRLKIETIESLKIAVGTKHPKYAKALNDLAASFADQGYYSEAIRLGTEAMEIRKEILGPNHPSYAESLHTLALIQFCQGNTEGAISLTKEVIEIDKEIYGVDHPHYARSLGSLALCYSDIGNYDEAIKLGTKALNILGKILGTEHPDYATTIGSLALYNDELGNHLEAINLGTKVTEIMKNVYGTNHKRYAESLNNLSSSYCYLRNYPIGYNLLLQSLNISQEIILSRFSEMSSGLQESLWKDKYSYEYNSYFPSIVYRHQISESVTELYDKTALFAKGILLNTSIAMRKQILESGDSALIDRYYALVANKSIFDMQLEKPINERFLDIDSLRSVIQRQEMELVRDSKAYGDFARNLRINWKDVQQKLGNDDIAIEFLDFPLVGSDSTMYVALTLKQGYDNPHMTILFEKRQLKSIPEDNYYTHNDLYDLIWTPIEEELAGVKNIYFSPSGDLHRIGIEYVPVTMTENICDKYILHRLSSTRQLAFIQDDTKGEKSVLYGGLKYDAVVSDTIPVSSSTRENRSFTFVPRAIVDSLDIRGSYKYLPGTKEEADHIVSYLNTHSIPYKYYYGVAGTEESFKGLDGSKPKTLHIATHGFYMTEQDAERKNFARPLLQEETRVYHEDKPMTRSGLLLSGCSRALNHENIPDGIEDGILTADEISKLDLRGLDLVVLSACQTGLGDITSGEGVFGLQRGFKNAGAKTIIMSLWKVSDIATQHLMTSFYNHYLSGMPKEQSFRMAQKELREMIDPGQNKPDWAAFVMLDGI